jgi:hypothetical protein
MFLTEKYFDDLTQPNSVISINEASFQERFGSETQLAALSIVAGHVDREFKRNTVRMCAERAISRINKINNMNYFMFYLDSAFDNDTIVRRRINSWKRNPLCSFSETYKADIYKKGHLFKNYSLSILKCNKIESAAIDAAFDRRISLFASARTDLLSEDFMREFFLKSAFSSDGDELIYVDLASTALNLCPKMCVLLRPWAQFDDSISLDIIYDKRHFDLHSS